jgi:hypothetical protein
MVDNPTAKPPEPAKSGEIIAPASPDLVTLAKQIKAELDAFKIALLGTVEKAIVIGKHLIKAKKMVEEQLGPGHWLDWQAANIGVPERKAQRWMSIAEKEAELRLKYPDLSKITMTGQLRLIEELKDPDDNSGTTPRTTSSARKTPVDKAIERDALAVLKRAWRKCNVEQQDAFRQEIIPA